MICPCKGDGCIGVFGAQTGQVFVRIRADDAVHQLKTPLILGMVPLQQGSEHPVKGLRGLDLLGPLKRMHLFP